VSCPIVSCVSFVCNVVIPLTSICVCSFISLRGIVNAGNAYELLKNGCEFAGGDSNPPADEGLSYFALGGKDQVVGLPTPAPSPIPPCPGAQERFEVQILTDDWPQETTWTLTDQCGSNGEMMSGGPYTGSPNTLFSEMSACVDGQYEFIINVSYFQLLRVFIFISPLQNNQLLTVRLCVYAIIRTHMATAFAAVMVKEVTS
jgi:hypothetical protein